MANVILNIATDMEKENFFSTNGYSAGELLQLTPDPDGLEDFIFNQETGFYEYTTYSLAVETGKVVIKKSGFDQDPTTLTQNQQTFEQRYFYLSRTVKEDQSADAKTLQHIDFKQSRRAMVNINGGDDYTGFNSLDRFEDENDIRHFAYYLKGDDTIYGSNEGDKIYAFSGDDSIYLRGGNSFIHGGAGYDIAHLPGKREDYIVREISDSITELRSFSNIFTFEAVESLIFEDDEHVYVAELEKLPPILENNWHQAMRSGTSFRETFADQYGNIAVTGETSIKLFDHPNQTVKWDAYIALFDSSGQKLWDDILGSEEYSFSTATAIINENLLVAGKHSGSILGNQNEQITTSSGYFLRSYNLDGSVNWTKEINDDPVKITDVGNDAFLINYAAAPKNYDANNSLDIFFECYSGSGDLLWETTYSSTPIIDHTGRESSSYDKLADAIVLEDNTIYTVGVTTGGTDKDTPRENVVLKPFIQKITPAGHITWTKELDIPYTSYWADTLSLFTAGDSLYALHPIPSGQQEEITPLDWFNINARYSSNYPDYALTKINDSGEVEWTKGFQNAVHGGSMPVLIEQNNGNILLTWSSREAKTFSDTHIPVLSEEDSDNISLASLDPDGNLIWGTTVGSREDDWLRGASLKGDSLTLSFSSRGQFDDSINSYGGYNYYISNYKLNPFYAVPPASYELKAPSNQLLADYPYLTTLSTTRVPEGTELFWRIEGNWPAYSKPNFETGLEGSGFINDAGELAIKHIYTASSHTEGLEASIHVYADQKYSNKLVSSAPFSLSDFNYSLSVDSEKSDNQVIEEGNIFSLKGSLPEATSGEAIHWKLILDETDANDWATPSIEGHSLLKSDGSFEIILETTADQKTEGWAEDFQIQLFADDQQKHALGKAQDFRLIDNSHEDFKGYPNSVHALKLLSDTYKNDLSKWDSDVGNGFYDEIWDRFSGLVPRIDLPIGNNKKELFWHIYSAPGDNSPGADIMHARGGSGEDHFLGCVDRTLEELHQGQAGIGPIRGDVHDGYLDIQDFDPTEDLLILPFNSDQPIYFDGSFLSVTTPSGATDKIFRLADGGFALSDLRNAIAYLDTINNGTIPTYNLNTSTTNLNEGHQLTTALTTKNLPAGTTLHWAIHGSVDADDFSLGDLSGSITTGDSSSNTLSHALDLDQFTEGDERFSLTFYADAQHQRVLAETPLISINDSSRDPAQSLFSSAEQVHFFPGSTLSIPIHYSNNTGKSELSELIANIHFDSSVLTPTSSTDKPGVSWMLGADDNLGPSVRVIPETSANADGNPTTDSILELNWKHRRADSHSSAAQAHVATLSFQTNQDPITGAPAASSLNFTANQTANGYEFLTTQTALISEPFNLDIDGDNQASLYTDGIMIIRRLIGLDQCTSGFGSEFFNESGRHSAARVEERLDEAFNNGFFDFNQDGKTSLYSDGILLIRYMISPQLLQSSGEVIGQDSPFNNNPEHLMAAFHALEPSIS